VVLVSASAGRRAAAALARCHAPFEWAYFGDDTSRMLRWRQLLGEERQIPLGRRTMERARRIVPSYVSWIGDLGERERGNLLWSVSEISERNVYRPSRLLPGLTLLSLWRDLLLEERARSLLVIVESVPFATTLARNDMGRAVRAVGFRGRRLLHHATFPARLCWTKARSLAGALLRWALARRAAACDGVPGVLVHTWATPAREPDGPFNDNHFGPLPEWLRKRGARPVLVPWFFGRTSYREYLRQVARSQIPAIVPERVLTLGDIIVAWLLPVWRGWLPRGRAFTWDGMDVSPLVREARRLHVESFRPSDALLRYFFVRRLAAQGVRPECVVHIFEAHAWEKALRLGTRAFSPGTEVVGFQHNAFSEFETNYCLARQEAQAAAQPDRIVCQGARWADLLAENGFDRHSLSVGAALRFEHLFADRDRVPPAPRGEGGGVTVLVAPGADPDEAIDTLVKVFRAFGSRTDARVIIKEHPLAPAGRLVWSALAASGRAPVVPPHFSLAGGALAEWLSRVDLLIYGGTTAGWEAVVAGVPAVFAGRECGLSMDPVRVETAGKRHAFTAEELGAAVDALLAMGPAARARAREEGENVLGEWFCPVREESLAEFWSPAGAAKPAHTRSYSR
jgi:hypothetical protein